MDHSSTELTSELDAFRKQWLSEVQSKRTTAPTAPTASASHQGPPHTGSSVYATVPISSVSRTRRESGSKALAPAPAPAPTSPVQPGHADDDYVQPPAFEELFGDAAALKGKEPEGRPGDTGDGGLVSALDHFEAAVMREAQGSLGDSLNLYRKAFRMDSRVDQTYRKKHFGTPASRPPQSTPPQATAATPAKPTTPAKPPTSLSISDLISSFQGLAIVPAPPEIQGTPAPPCPISDLPEEILCHVFRDVAVLDVADFARLSRVCKRFAYLVATEERIWRRVCLGSEFGFAGMHYRFQTDVHWNALPPTYDDEEGDEGSGGKDGEKDEVAVVSVEESPSPPLWLTPEEQAERTARRKEAITLSLLPTFYSSSWKKMWRNRPRIRFNGCYISTVNYIRSGISNANHITWGSPVHIVTYYRYLRFFRDGTAISMLHTTEPVDVVPYLTKELVETHRGGAAPHLPSAVMQNALHGRWRLVSDPKAAGGENPEGDLVVETEGVSDYIYRMDLSLRSAGKAARNNKLVWRGFYSYNKLTDDWAEFELKNDKAFFFSRVRSFGLGE